MKKSKDNNLSENKKLGNKGENRAAKYLKKKGYAILDRNCVFNVGEIDIVAFDKTENTYVFVEVKTGSDDYFASPSEKVDYVKQRKYKLLAVEYLTSKHLMGSNARFDVIEIVYKKDSRDVVINHYIDAYR